MRLAKTGTAGFLLLVLAMAPAAQAQSSWWGDRFTPQAPAVDQAGRREWPWQGGSALAYGGPGRLRYEQGGTPRIIVTGDPQMVRSIEVSGGDIRRRDNNSFFGGSRGGDAPVNILVQGVTLDNFTLSGSAIMDLGRLQRDKLTVQVNGSGSVIAQGQARRLGLQVNGSGNANLAQMNAGEADLAVNGSGSAALGAIGEGSIQVTGSGRASLGDADKHVDVVVTGSGDVTMGRVYWITARLTGSGNVKLASKPRTSGYGIIGSGRVLLAGPDGKVTELAGPEKRNEQRAQQQREREQARREEERERQQAREERQREREQQQAEREREREQARRERQRDRDRN